MLNHLISNYLHTNQLIRIIATIVIFLLAGSFCIINDFSIVFILVALFGCTLIFILAPLAFFLFVVISKPLIDLTNRLEYEGINIQSGWTLLVSALFLLYFGSYIILHRERLKSMLFIPLFIFIAINFGNIFLSSNIQGAVADFVRIVSGIPLLLTGWIFLRDKQFLKKFTWSFIFVLFIPATIGYLQHFGFIPTSAITTVYVPGTLGEVVQRVTCGYFASPRTFPLYLTFALPLGLVLLNADSNTRKKILLISFLTYICIVGALTYIRAFIPVIFIELLVYAYLKRKLKLRLFLFILMVVSIFYFREYFQMLFTKELIDPLTSGEIIPFHGRYDIWTIALRYFSERPLFLKFFGNGLYPQIYGLGQLTTNDVHSDYIRLLIESGIVGLFFYLLVLGILLKEASYVIKHSTDKFIKEFAIAFQCIIWGVLVWSITTRPSEYVPINWYVYLMTSVILYHKYELLKINHLSINNASSINTAR